MSKESLKQYALSIRRLLRANAQTPETGLAPSFQQLVTALLPTLPLAPRLIVSPEYNKPGVGRPDIALIRQGQPARAFIELKAPTKPADPARWRDAHDKRQFERLKELGHWATSNFAEFHLFHLSEEFGNARIVPAKALDPTTGDVAADKLIDAHDAAPFLDLLSILSRADAPTARNAEHLAQLLAHSSRLVRSTVAERLSQLNAQDNTTHPLVLVRETFRNVLYAHPEAGGYSAASFDDLFSSAFAQTLAFGLLLVRESLTDDPNLTEAQRNVDANAWERMPEEHPLMRAALRVLSEPEIAGELGIGFDVMCDTVNSFAPEILAPRLGGRDPILYFYEDFLQTFDPAARDRYGVYYTPIEVVRYMVGALDRALIENLGTQGLRDRDVTILDPATGTGTFLLGIAERVRDAVLAEESPASASLALKDLAGRLFGFELLVGPYAVAHYRLHHALKALPKVDGEPDPPEVRLPRLGVYLADTLANPDAKTPEGTLGIQGIPIDDERALANEIKNRRRIIAIIGNPPYKRLAEGENDSLVGRWMDDKWDDLKKPVRDAGQGGQLNTFPEFSVAFWRWAIWKLFEADNAPQKGVIAFITNRKFLTGWPYAGLRKMMRERFDRIEVIDLRGDVRAGPRGDVEDDSGVFNIMVGTAITIAIADGSKAKGALADVTYTDCWQEGVFGRKAKLEWLTSGADAGQLPNSKDIDRDTLEDWRPEPFSNGEWLSLAECFIDKFSGVETTRDHLAYAFSLNDLKTQIDDFISLSETEALARYSQTRKANFAVARVRPFSTDRALSVGYRPLDRRQLFNEVGYVDWPRPQLQSAWGSTNKTLFSMAYATGGGSATWLHPCLPDRHAFKGSTGGYAFPLYDRRNGPDAHNLDTALLAALAEAYGELVTPEQLFDAILCLLSAKSYTRRFAEDLEDTFPHIPFPATHAVFARAAAIGTEIRGLEAFERAPGKAFSPRAFFYLASEPNAPIGPVTMRDGELLLCEDGSGKVTGVPDAVWSFSVSGYRVLPRWIDGRRGLSAAEYWPQLRDVAARIAELIHRFDEADLVLNDTLADTLTREELGFPEPVEAAEAEGDD